MTGPEETPARKTKGVFATFDRRGDMPTVMYVTKCQYCQIVTGETEYAWQIEWDACDECERLLIDAYAEELKRVGELSLDGEDR